MGSIPVLRIMNTKDLIRLGVPPGEATRRGIDLITKYILSGQDKTQLEPWITKITQDPQSYVEDPNCTEFAKSLIRNRRSMPLNAAPWIQWGKDLEPEAVNQMGRACQLPVAVAGALMPDAHVGYGLPIGGVLATENAVIPYAVGVDIACRMRLTVVDLPVRELSRKRDDLIAAIEKETRFGVGSTFKEKREHPVMDADWNVCRTTRINKDRAWSQLGTSGSGNHFVEFGVFTNSDRIDALEAGAHIALLSHSGSRGTGAAVCDYYSKLAMSKHPELSKEHKHLAWLDINTQEGLEYWAAMELMGKYAAANHRLIHQHLISRLRLSPLLEVENHHNFAWKEKHLVHGVERDLIVHRKGATPAGSGILGIIPGSMAAPGFLVRGKGNAFALNSASHGAGRLMSRTKAIESLSWDKVKRTLKDRDVHLISAGLDEAPSVYKDIHQVMNHQTDLVEILGQFDPKLVKMAPHGERPED